MLDKTIREGSKVLVTALGTPRIFLREQREWVNVGQILTITAIEREKLPYYVTDSKGDTRQGENLRIGFRECCQECRAKRPHYTVSLVEVERTMSPAFNETEVRYAKWSEVFGTIMEISRFYSALPGAYPTHGRLVFITNFKYEAELRAGQLPSRIHITEIIDRTGTSTNSYFSFEEGQSVPSHLVAPLFNYRSQLEKRLSKSRLLEQKVRLLVKSLEKYIILKSGENANEQKPSEESKAVS